jgi:hypothetical protein
MCIIDRRILCAMTVVSRGPGAKAPDRAIVKETMNTERIVMGLFYHKRTSPSKDLFVL